MLPPDAATLRALADKYRRLLALREARDGGEAAPHRDVLRALAAEFPGSLRELDTLDAAELKHRASACEAAAAGASVAPFMTWIATYHDVMKAALAARAGDGSCLAIDPVLAARLCKPPGGRASPAVIAWIAASAGVDPHVVSACLFPARRPAPYSFPTVTPSRLLCRITAHESATRTAVVELDAGGSSRSYAACLAGGRAVARALRRQGPRPTVALFAPPSALFVQGLLGTWLAGGVVVPLSPLHTAAELTHAIETAGVTIVLTTGDLAARLPPLPVCAQALRLDALVNEPPPEATTALPTDTDAAIVLFTSGTTGKPKGVVHTHAALAATTSALEHAWGWRADDRLLHVLPLHHTHGVIVALLGALWAGAETRFLPFEARGCWNAMADATVFMAVPTIYAKLCEAYDHASAAERARCADNASRLRLATSGSAALSPALFSAFAAIAGRPPLERYGMTEIGMALSNPLDGARVPGAVGVPLPGVHIDLVTDDERPCGIDEPGELRVRSTQMFAGYHGDPAATAASFDSDGRFRTGDTGVRGADGVIRLLGRTSVDVLKSGGYKLSALEIEESLRAHPAIADVAVVGVPDKVWGDAVTACVVLRAGVSLDLETLRAWARERMAPYKVPRNLRLLSELPRNAMGKVQKAVLKSQG